MSALAAMVSEVRTVTVGVADLERALAFYADALGYEPVARGDAHAGLARLWGHDPALGVEWAVVAADASGRGRIRLVSGDRPGCALWTPDNRMRATGCYALNFRCRDIHACLGRIRRAGGNAGDEPHFWEVSDAVAVYDTMSCDPDGTCLDLFSYARGGERRGPLETPVSVVQTVALAVADVAASRAFYEALGFVELFDQVLDFDGLSEMLGLDRPARIRNANLIKDGNIVPGRVEMFEFLDTGLPRPAPLGAAAAPPNLGPLSFSLVCSDVAEVLAGMAGAGAQLLYEADGPMDVPGFGRSRAAALAGPDGERIELVEPLESGHGV